MRYSRVPLLTWLMKIWSRNFTFGFVPLVSLRPFPVFKDGFLTATLTLRPFLMRLSSRWVDWRVRSISQVLCHPCRTSRAWPSDYHGCYLLCIWIFRLVFHVHIYCTSHQDKPGFWPKLLCKSSCWCHLRHQCLRKCTIFLTFNMIQKQPKQKSLVTVLHTALKKK